MIQLKYRFVLLMAFLFALGFAQNPTTNTDSIAIKKDLIQYSKYWIIDSVSYGNVFLQKQELEDNSKSISKYLTNGNSGQNEVEIDEHSFRIKYNLHYSLCGLYSPTKGILEGIYVPKGEKRKYQIIVISSDKIKLTQIR